MPRRSVTLLLGVFALAAIGCKGGREAAVKADSTALALFAPLPEVMASDANPVTDAKVALGRVLYYETRLSKDGSLSCNSCHHLADFGADTGRVSEGVGHKLGGRNSPTVYNAAGHMAQFWDGRAPDVEGQALGPILNPVEMAMADERQVLRTIGADPAYRELFRAAFPGDRNPLTYANVGRAIGAFERRLVTPSRWDRFLRGEDTALTTAEKQGFNTFASVGCTGCHSGAYVGGGLFQKAGLVTPWPDTTDVGREAVTKQASDRFVFKVPSLRNIEHTAPYFHNGDTRTLDSAVVMMGSHQLGRALTAEEVVQITTWLRALTGEIPTAYIEPPPSRL